MHNKLFFYALLIPAISFAMDAPEEQLTAIEKEKDAEKFNGRIVAFTSPWGHAHIAAYELANGKPNIRYGRISTEIKGADWPHVPYKRYLLTPLRETRLADAHRNFMSSGVYLGDEPICQATLESETARGNRLAMRLVNLAEIKVIQDAFLKAVVYFKLEDLKKDNALIEKEYIRARYGDDFDSIQ